MRDHRFCGAVVSSLVMIQAIRAASGGLPEQIPAANLAPPVAVDFRVVAGDGQPVVDLGRDEIVLRVGGRTRPIKDLTLVHAAGARRPFATNTLAGLSSRSQGSGWRTSRISPPWRTPPGRMCTWSMCSTG